MPTVFSKLSYCSLDNNPQIAGTKRSRETETYQPTKRSLIKNNTESKLTSTLTSSLRSPNNLGRLMHGIEQAGGNTMPSDDLAKQFINRGQRLLADIDDIKKNPERYQQLQDELADKLEYLRFAPVGDEDALNKCIYDIGLVAEKYGITI